LGWAPGGDREILTREQMEQEFSLDRVGASPSVFDPEKLLWMNAQYVARMPAEELLERARAHASNGVPERDAALRAIDLHRTRARTIIELGRALSAYAADPADYDPDGLKKHVKPETAGLVGRLADRYAGLSEWTAAATEAALREAAEAEGLAAGK